MVFFNPKELIFILRFFFPSYILFLLKANELFALNGNLRHSVPCRRITRSRLAMFARIFIIIIFFSVPRIRV